MPGSVVQLCVRLAGAQVFRLDSMLEAVKVCGLRVVPLLTTMEPLKAVVVEVTAQRDSRGESAVAESLECVLARYFINVADKQDVALLRRLLS